MDYVEINANTEEGFQDLKFRIDKYWNDECNNFVCIVYGYYKNDKVGFGVSFKPGMEPGMINGEFNNSAFYNNGISLFSIGEESNNFVKALSMLYCLGFKEFAMVEVIGFTAYALEGDPRNINNEELKFKVFYDDSFRTGLYSELYVNINVKSGILEFKEKDTEYRKNIYSALVGKKPNFIIRFYKKVFKKI